MSFSISSTVVETHKTAPSLWRLRWRNHITKADSCGEWKSFLFTLSSEEIHSQRGHDTSLEWRPQEDPLLTCSSVILRSIASLSSPKNNDDAELENKKKDTSSSISCSLLTTKPHKKNVINPWRIALNKTSGTRFWSRWCKWFAIVWYTCECLSEF